MNDTKCKRCKFNTTGDLRTCQNCQRSQFLNGGKWHDVRTEKVDDPPPSDFNGWDDDYNEISPATVEPIPGLVADPSPGNAEIIKEQVEAIKKPVKRQHNTMYALTESRKSCPLCKGVESKILKTWNPGQSKRVRRRRQCLECEGVYNTVSGGTLTDLE